MSKQFIKGNEAMAESAVRAGCRFLAGYPITPQNEIPEYLSWRLSEVGGHFIQGESEIASIHMVFGVASTGIRSMTSTSSPGLSLMTDGIALLMGGRVPSVIVDVARGGPALGTIEPSQQDYLAVVHSPAPGGNKCFVLAPQNVQEAADLVYKSFDIADKYRTPVIVLADGMIGNMMEVVELPPMRDIETLPSNDSWRVNRLNDDGSFRLMSTYRPTGPEMQELNKEAQDLYQKWDNEEQKWDEYLLDDAEYIICAYGSSARIAKSAVKELRESGVKAGLIRPITLVPFPKDVFEKLNYKKIKKMFCAEMSIPGQLIWDVKFNVMGRSEIIPIQTSGGVIIETEMIVNAVKSNL